MHFFPIRVVQSYKRVMTWLTGLYKIRKDYKVNLWILSNNCWIISLTWIGAWIHHTCFSYYLMSYVMNLPFLLRYKRYPRGTALFHCEGWVILYNGKWQPPLAEMKAAF